MKVKSAERREAIEKICNDLLSEFSNDSDNYVTSISEILKRKKIQMKTVSKKFFEENLNLDVGAVALFRKSEDLSIILLSEDSYPKQEDKIFTIAHEIGHYFIHMQEKNNYLCYRHKKNITSDEKNLEDESDYFASCLLMPENKIRKALELYPDVASVETLSKLFEVSKEAMVKRLEELKIPLQG